MDPTQPMGQLNPRTTLVRLCSYSYVYLLKTVSFQKQTPAVDELDKPGSDGTERSLPPKRVHRHCTYSNFCVIMVCPMLNYQLLLMMYLFHVFCMPSLHGEGSCLWNLSTELMLFTTYAAFWLSPMSYHCNRTYE